LTSLKEDLALKVVITDRNQPATVNPSVAGSAPPLSVWTKAVYGAGSMAESIALYTVATFALLYYNQVLGAPAQLVGLALSAGLLLDGLTDPLIGSLSDRTRSKFGRRHPYMFAAPVPIALSFYALFNPPALGPVQLSIWCAVFVVVMRQCMTFFHTPHLALGGELSAGYTERSRIMAWNTFFSWGGGSFAWWMALAVFFPATALYPRGLLNPEPWPRYAAFMAATILVVLIASAWFTKDRIPFLTQPSKAAHAFSPIEFARDVGRAFRNINYVWLLAAYFCLSMMNGVREALTIYIGTFYWQLTSEQLSWFILGSFAGYLFGFAASAWMHRVFDKKPTIIVSSVAYALGPSVPIVLGLAGVLTPHTPHLAAILIALNVLLHAPVSVLTISVMSALADISDENRVQFGVSQEGVLYSTRALFAKVDQAVGAALAGIVLSLISFPAKAAPGHVSQLTLDNLAMAYGLAAIPGLVATVFYSQYRITRQSYERTRDALLPAEEAAATGPGV
jgi:Na+/melibiose symporter-like transporter